MPKPLTRPQPSSSLANALRSSSLKSATGEPGTHNVRPVEIDEDPDKVVGVLGPSGLAPAAAIPTGEPANIPRQFMVTNSLDRVLKRATKVYSDATGIDITNSEFLRVVLTAIDQAIPTLEREAKLIGPLKREKNARGNEGLRDLRERRMAKAFNAGMRAASEMA